MKNSEKYFKLLPWLVIFLLPTLSTGCRDSAVDVPTSKIVTSEVAVPNAPSAKTGINGLGKGPEPVLLGTVGCYVILAKSAISTSGSSTVTGNIGLSPATAKNISGFSLSVPVSLFSTSPQVDGKIFAADYANSTADNLTMSVDEMLTAYKDAAGRVPEFTELGSGIIGGMTLAPAIYRWSTAVLIPTDVTLKGGANDVWIFQIGQGLTQASAAQVILTGGALPKNVFWQVVGAVDIGAAAHMEGVILSRSSITLGAGASAIGRLLAQTSINLDANVVTQPAP